MPVHKPCIIALESLLTPLFVEVSGVRLEPFALAVAGSVHLLAGWWGGLTTLPNRRSYPVTPKARLRPFYVPPVCKCAGVPKIYARVRWNCMGEKGLGVSKILKNSGENS